MEIAKYIAYKANIYNIKCKLVYQIDRTTNIQDEKSKKNFFNNLHLFVLYYYSIFILLYYYPSFTVVKNIR